MQKWAWTSIAWFFTACGLIGCAADSDSGGLRLPSGGGGNGASGAAAGSAAAGGSGGTGFGDIGVPVTPTGGSTSPVPVMNDAGGECGAVSQTAENMLQPVDIIIGVDTSGSMSEEIAFVQQHLNAFSQQIIDSGIDVHVILLATQSAGSMPAAGTGGGLFGGGGWEDFGVCIDAPLGSGTCPADTNPPVYSHYNVEVGSNDVLDVFVNAYQTYKPSLRENSLKTFLSITDDDAAGEDEVVYDNADAFIAAINALEPNSAMWANWRYSSIYCFTQCAAAAAPGLVHADLVAKTMGVGGDLCLQDFQPVFNELAEKVVDAVTLACDWEIPAPPGSETFDAAKTNVRLNIDGNNELLSKAADPGACADQNGWHYDDAANPTRVLACPTTCNRIQAAQDASVDILFGCETVVIVLE